MTFVLLLLMLMMTLLLLSLLLIMLLPLLTKHKVKSFIGCNPAGIIS